MALSENLLERLLPGSDVEVLSPPQPLPFDARGDLVDLLDGSRLPQ
jgi:hypothetical protein